MSQLNTFHNDIPFTKDLGVELSAPTTAVR